ncbi:MAG: alpha/beta hydrolase [Candidatus Dojkabacteria bacterium]|nr:alpha/beta hydrolase [Candidatus Dojkabacteria bacterium]
MNKNKIKKSFYIFSIISLILYIKNRIDIKKAEKEFPNLGNFCYIQGSRVHYLEEGKGETIVFLHDDGGDIYDFYLSSIWNNLKNKFKLIAIDRPGFGYSGRLEWKEYGYKNQARIINETLEYLNIDKCTLVCLGKSSGIGYTLLSENNKIFKSLIIVDDKFNVEKTFIDKLLSLKYINKFISWTLLPIIYKGNLKLSYSISDELIDKYKFLDTHPNKIIYAYQNKLFYRQKEIINVLEKNIENKIKTPIKIINFENNSLFENLNLNKYFENYEYVKIKSLTSLDILNSDDFLNGMDL